MSVFDTLYPSDTKTMMVTEDKRENVADVEMALQSINPSTSPYATAILQTELRKLKGVI